MRTPLSCLYVKDDEYSPSGVMPEISKMLFFITLKTFILLKKKKDREVKCIRQGDRETIIPSKVTAFLLTREKTDQNRHEAECTYQGRLSSATEKCKTQ